MSPSARQSNADCWKRAAMTTGSSTSGLPQTFAWKKVAIAISQTSNRCSRTIGAKARLIVGISANSRRRRSEMTWPDFSALVCLELPIAVLSTGWSLVMVPAPVFLPMLSAFRRPAIRQSLLRQLLPHAVDVEAEFAGLQPRAGLLLLALTRLALAQHFFRGRTGHYNDAIIVGDDEIAGMNELAGADDRNVDGAKRLLDRTLGGNRLGPDREAHFRQCRHVAAAGLDHQAEHAARRQRAGQQLPEIAGV